MNGQDLMLEGRQAYLSIFPDGDHRERAERLYRTGQRLLNEGRWERGFLIHGLSLAAREVRHVA